MNHTAKETVSNAEWHELKKNVETRLYDIMAIIFDILFKQRLRLLLLLLGRKRLVELILVFRQKIFLHDKIYSCYI